MDAWIEDNYLHLKARNIDAAAALQAWHQKYRDDLTDILLVIEPLDALELELL